MDPLSSLSLKGHCILNRHHRTLWIYPCTNYLWVLVTHSVQSASETLVHKAERQNAQEMSELLDKQVNVQKEKIFQGSRKLPQAHEKVCDENESRIRKKTTRA